MEPIPTGGESAGSPTELPHEAYLAALCSLDGVGPGRLRWLLSLGPPDRAWEAVRTGRLPSPPHRLALRPATIAAWRSEALSLDPAACWRRCVRLGVGVVSLGSPGYPPALADDAEPPVVLFHLGDPDRIAPRRVAIVGTRRATGYGLRTAERLGRELAAAGVSVVSGLALGIDAAAHRGAVDGGGAAPVAVVGGGLDAPCPSRNLTLARSVTATGVIFSEVPPGVAAAPWRFPVRNRILAALADVVVVVESAGGGGSMHTVREALQRDRPVLAVPGPIDSRASEGTNQLIAEGAEPCRQVADVLMALGFVAPVRPVADPHRPDPRPRPGERAGGVLERVGWRPVSAEQLAQECGLDFRQLSIALGELETAGWIQRTGSWIERVARPPDHP